MRIVVCTCSFFGHICVWTAADQQKRIYWYVVVKTKGTWHFLSLSSDSKHSVAINYLSIASGLVWAEYSSIDLTSQGSVTVNAVLRSALLWRRCHLSACSLCSVLQCIHGCECVSSPPQMSCFHRETPACLPLPRTIPLVSLDRTYLHLSITRLFSSASQGRSLQEDRN